MTVYSFLSTNHSDYRQSPLLDDLSTGHQLIVWAIRVAMDEVIPRSVKDALLEEAFLRVRAPDATEKFLEFMDFAARGAEALHVFAADYVSRDELELMRTVEPRLRRSGFSIE